jgi:hypothetical protein
MLNKKSLGLEDYLIKVQEAADEIATERNQRKIIVFHLPECEFACRRTGNKMGTSILKEALSRVNKKYKLKLEE